MLPRDGAESGLELADYDNHPPMPLQKHSSDQGLRYRGELQGILERIDEACARPKTAAMACATAAADDQARAAQGHALCHILHPVPGET